jgi:hypothetical protein
MVVEDFIVQSPVVGILVNGPKTYRAETMICIIKTPIKTEIVCCGSSFPFAFISVS